MATMRLQEIVDRLVELQNAATYDNSDDIVMLNVEGRWTEIREISEATDSEPIFVHSED